MTDQANEICASCGAEPATLTCPHCENAPPYLEGVKPISEPTFYCSETCLEAGRLGRHANKCAVLQTRIRIVRTGEVLKSLVSVIRRRIYFGKIGGIDVVEGGGGEGGDDDNDDDDDETLVEVTMAGAGVLWFWPLTSFDRGLVNNDTVRDMLLLHSAGVELFTYLPPFSKAFFKEMQVSHTGMAVKVKPGQAPYTFKIVNRDNETFPTSEQSVCFKIKTVRRGQYQPEEWAVDPTVAQFGPLPTCQPLATYIDNLVDEVVNDKGDMDTKIDGFMAVHICELFLDKPAQGQQQQHPDQAAMTTPNIDRKMDWTCRAREVMKISTLPDAIEAAIPGNIDAVFGGSLGGVLHGTDEEFAVKKMAMVDAVDGVILDYLHRTGTSGTVGLDHKKRLYEEWKKQRGR